MFKQLYRGIYVCLGYPSLPQSLDCLAISQQHPNIDFIELGLPFSDPVADGPIISSAIQSALKLAQNQGISPRLMLEQALESLSNSSKDIYLMTYGNMVYQLLQQCGRQTFNTLPLKGLIIPDVPLCEQSFFLKRGLKHSIIPFATPETTEPDLQLLSQPPASAAPFVYFVALRGITGTRGDLNSQALRAQYAQVFTASQAKRSGQAARPVILGFGIQGPAEIAQLGEFANGFVVGTAAVKLQDSSLKYRQFLDSLF